MRRLPVRARLLVAGVAAAIATLGAAATADAFVYWANFGGVGTSGGTTIGRANLDGSGRDNGFVGGASDPCGVAVNDTHLFWANNDQTLGTTLGRASIDGSAPTQAFVTGASSPCFVTVDDTHLYWTNRATGTVGRSDLDGTNANQGFISGAGNTPCGVAVTDTHVYWAIYDNDAIGRATIGGGSVDTAFITGANGPCGIAVNSAHVYWTNFDDSQVGRANLDGSGVDHDFIDGGDRPCGVAVDDGHVYWANFFNLTLGRANLDGSGVDQTFVTGLGAFPCGIAVDDGIRTAGAAVACSPASAALNQPVTCTATISDSSGGVPTAPTGSVGFSSASGGADFPSGAACNLVPAGAGQSSCSVTYRPGFGANLVLGFYGGDVAHEAAQAVGQVSVGSYGLGAVTFNRRAGTATLIANAPGPGVVTQTGDRTAPQSASVAGAGPVSLLITATGAALRKLKRTGSVTVVAETDFDPSGGGQEGSANQPVRLVKQKPKKKRKKRK